MKRSNFPRVDFDLIVTENEGSYFLRVKKLKNIGIMQRKRVSSPYEYELSFPIYKENGDYRPCSSCISLFDKTMRKELSDLLKNVSRDINDCLKKSSLSYITLGKKFRRLVNNPNFRKGDKGRYGYRSGGKGHKCIRKYLVH